MAGKIAMSHSILNCFGLLYLLLPCSLFLSNPKQKESKRCKPAFLLRRFISGYLRG